MLTINHQGTTRGVYRQWQSIKKLPKSHLTIFCSILKWLGAGLKQIHQSFFTKCNSAWYPQYGNTLISFVNRWSITNTGLQVVLYCSMMSLPSGQNDSGVT